MKTQNTQLVTVQNALSVENTLKVESLSLNAALMDSAKKSSGLAKGLRTLAAAMMATMVLATPARSEAASSGPYSMEVLVNGRPVQEFYKRGTTYVEARQGLEYQVRLTNHTGRRVAVALALDGLNSIDAKHTSAAAARKWILAPYETMVVTGWQTSNATARAFYFTSESGSYGAWLGDTRNLGNISAAFFAEKQHYVRPMTEEPWDDNPWLSRELNRESMGGAADAAKAAPAPSLQNEAASGRARSGAGASAERMAAPKDELAATGIGREQYNSVYTVAFDQESSPSGVVTLRYEYHDKLVQLGVLPRPYRPTPMIRRENSSGFSDYGYAPDPYRGR